jgi:hypothetical protein
LTRARGLADDDRVRRIAGSAALELTLALALVASCTSSLVPAGPARDDDDHGDDPGSNSEDGPTPENEDGNVTTEGDGDDGTTGASSGGGITASDGDDVPADSGDEVTDSGDPIVCTEPEVPDVRAEVWPGSDPLEHAQILRELECIIEDKITAGDGVSFHLSCSDQFGPLASLVVVGVEAEAISVPATLAPGVAVHARVYTGRDLDDIEAFPWRRADHFALYRDGVLVLGAGAGLTLPSTNDGEEFVDFWSPLVLDVLPSECPGEPRECHSPMRGIWEISSGGTSSAASPFSVLQIAGYEVQLGELVNSDTPQCGEPPFKWMTFAIAPV